MGGPRPVQDKLEGSINIWFIFGLAGAISAFQFGISLYQNEQTLFIVQQLTQISAFSTALSAIFVGSTYSRSKVFGHSFIILGAGYFCIFVGETIYTIQDFITFEDPYPSIADLFFFMAYPFIISHMLINIRYFGTKFNPKSILWMTLLGASIFFSYFALSASQSQLNFEFYYGLAFVLLPSITIPITLFGVFLFKGGLIGKAWLILLIGNLANAAGDIWYYHLETLNQYSLSQAVNIFWLFAYWVIVYAIYKHHKFTSQSKPVI